MPALLRSREFASRTRTFRYLDVADNWRTITVPAHGLAFTWCQVPILYVLNDNLQPALNIAREDGRHEVQTQLQLSGEDSSELFRRSGSIRQLTVILNTEQLFE